MRTVGSGLFQRLHASRAGELVVDRTVLVFSPPLHARIGPRLGPVRLFAEQPALWQAASKRWESLRRIRREFASFRKAG